MGREQAAQGSRRRGTWFRESPPPPFPRRQVLVDEEIRARASVRSRGVPEVRMHESDRAVNVGRGPACLRCGHTCHFSFVQIGTDRSRGGEKKGRGGRQLACLRHFEELPAEGRHLFVRHEDEVLRGIVARSADAKPASRPMLDPPAKTGPLPQAMQRAIAELDAQHKLKRQRRSKPS